MIGNLYGAIKTAFEGGQPDDAHDQLHEIAHVLEDDFPPLVNNAAALDDAAKSKLNELIAKLFDEFSKLDEELHGGPKADFAEVDKVVAETMSELKQLIP